MNLKDRMAVKKWIRDVVSTSIQDAGGSRIPTESAVKPALMEYEKEAYYRMIQPSSSGRSPSARRSPRWRRR
jgi:hypothetical protein